jgi:hypothetical protein
VSALAVNDFEPEVGARHPEIAAVIATARSTRPLIAQLTGSGSTVVIIPHAGVPTGGLSLPPGVTLVQTRTAACVEDVRLTG